MASTKVTSTGYVRGEDQDADEGMKKSVAALCDQMQPLLHPKGDTSNKRKRGRDRSSGSEGGKNRNNENNNDDNKKASGFVSVHVFLYSVDSAPKRIPTWKPSVTCTRNFVGLSLKKSLNPCDFIVWVLWWGVMSKAAVAGQQSQVCWL